MAEFSAANLDKILAELHRIGNAVEFLAMKADIGFMPLDPGMRQYRADLIRKDRQTTKPSVPQEREKS